MDRNEIKLPVGDRKLAFRLRQRFYGFRRALAKHDAGNPWLGALMETAATVDDHGDLLLQRSPFAITLRALLERSGYNPNEPGLGVGSLEPARPSEPFVDEGEKVIEELFGRGKKVEGSQ